MVKIKKIKAKEILDSKGRPTVKVILEADCGRFSASVPSGVSTGKYEAVELRDEDGRGVKKAIENIEKIIKPALEKEDLSDQKRIDEILIQLDGTKNKSRLGANAILAVSIAVCRAIAKSKNIPLYKYISEIAETNLKIPKPSFNMIEGGKHAESELAFQEFMIIPQNESFKENLEIGEKIYKKLKEILEKKCGVSIKLSDESAFSAPIKKVSIALDLILEAIEKTGQKDSIRIAIDAAASSFFKDGNYEVDGKILNKEELTDFYKNLIAKYPIISIEDPFEEEDFDSFSKLKNEIGDRIIIFGDDLTATNLERIKMAYNNNACSGVIIKPNQIGTMTETLEAAKLAKEFSWKIMVANRGGETKDDFIADLAVGIGAEFVKSGAPHLKRKNGKI